MDLAAHYRALVRKHFPQALIVADRFHVIRLIGLVYASEEPILFRRQKPLKMAGCGARKRFAGSLRALRKAG
jgi:transposase